MNENFLNSYAFEQMVREYNQKYGSEKATVLNKKEDEKLKLKVTNTFDKVFHLFYLLKIGFKQNSKFKQFFIEEERLETELKSCYKNLFESEFKEKEFLNKEKFVNHKIFTNEMLEVFYLCFEIEKERTENFLAIDYKEVNNDYIYKDKIGYIYNNLEEIFKKIVKLFKFFYELI